MSDIFFDEHFLRFLAQHCGEELPPAQAAIIRELCRAACLHHTCLPLDEHPKEVTDALLALPVCGAPGTDKPLVLSGDRLFLHRHYQMEKEVAELVTRRNEAREYDAAALHKRLNSLFGGQPSEPVDLQRLAVFQAASRRLAIITGGPGTGKTYVVMKIMQLLRQENPETKIRLAAPTGKAAMRLMETLGYGTGTGKAEELEALTLHRLLGVTRDGRNFRHDRDNPIPVDVLIIDEASMVDLVMMHRVLTALPEQARLILLGDPYQLPSVETGNVLGDLCLDGPSFSADFCKAAAASVGPLQPGGRSSLLTDALTYLEVSRRFADDSAIGRLAAATKSGTARLSELPKDETIEVQDAAALTPYNCAERLLPYWADYLKLVGKPGASAKALLEAFEQCRILCSQRQGFPGVLAINKAIEAWLERRRLKAPGSRYFHGQPILVTQNDYNLRLFNGDLGICVKEDGRWQVAFPAAGGGLRQFLASRLPAHETCYAMTVHKSQGSEFNRVILVLNAEPSPQGQELLTRELVYTGITRSRQFVTIYSDVDDWQKIMEKTAKRVSGMADFLA